MTIKENKGFVGIDMVVAIVAIILFTGLIMALMTTNFLANAKAKKEAYATIYLTETLENIGIAKYDEVTRDNIDLFIPQEAKDNNYNIELQIQGVNDLFEADETKEDIIKKVTATISYKIGNKDYQFTMERIKAK